VLRPPLQVARQLRRLALRAPPVELDAAGKPKPPSPSEQAFVEVGDVLLC